MLVTHPTASRPALVAGMSAQQLLDTVGADPAAGLTVGVQGAGGYGKTTLLTELARVYRAAGVEVERVGAAAEVSGRGAVLVDDAQHLPDAVVARLAELAGEPDARLIVAYRPWPRRPALADLVTALGRSGPPVILGGLDRSGVAAEVEKALGQQASKEMVDHLLARTGGVPRLVSRVVHGWAQDPASSGQSRLPSIVLDGFQHDLDQLGEQGLSCLTALSMGAPPHPDVLATVLEVAPHTATQALAAVRASGLSDPSGELFGIAREVAVAFTPADHRIAVLRKLVNVQLARGGPLLNMVRPLVESGQPIVGDPALADAFDRAANEAMASSPRLAGRLLAAAVTAGAPRSSVVSRAARAAAIAGDFDEALRLADEVMVDEQAVDRGLGVQVAASVLAHRGLLEQSAQLCRWSVEQVRWPGDQAFAVTGLLGVGRPDEADELVGTQGLSGPPTSLAGSAVQLANGVRESIGGSAATALSTLVRAASLSEPVGRTMLVPDSPPAIAATVALQCGEFDVAQSMLDRAVESGTGGRLLSVRHRLLAAWVPLLRGDTVSARSRLDVVNADTLTESGGGMHVRDRLMATALLVGIANRDNDMTGLAQARSQARQAVAEHPVDLFSLLPLGELVVAAARLRDREWIDPYLSEARALLGRLGDPPLWSALLHWKCLQAAIVLDDRDGVRTSTRQLESTAAHNPMAAALSGAAVAWTRVLGGTVDHEEVEVAARALFACGLAGDGARLAGQAALHTTNRPVMLALLEVARSLQGKPARPRAVKARPGAPDGEALSDREKEVAELVLSGLTYKQVGKRLYISAKTVEHHIGRIKQRLGCNSREELLNRLRELLSDQS